MNPNMVAQNRTARLAAQGVRPVYTTVTPVREHIMAVEWEWSTGGRWWVQISESEVDAYIAAETRKNGYKFFSDLDHAAQCWCFKG